MKESTKYVKIVEYSIEDSCYVGSCPASTSNKDYANKMLQVA